MIARGWGIVMKETLGNGQFYVLIVVMLHDKISHTYTCPRIHTHPHKSEYIQN